MDNSLANDQTNVNQTALFKEQLNNQYTVLARKYRPKDFSQLKGQDILVKTITNSIKFNRLHHAFLLTGIRGIGKTTTARIIAKTLNCTEKLTLDNFLVPCEKCMNCKAFNTQKHPDYIEIDAASKTGVADVREIIENSRYLPQISKYKIYVIDEVHMLSINAFNALLKTLEEPPKHIIFIFATTESQKIPLTIISRCQRFDLKMFSQNDIVTLLKNVLNNEKYEADENALKIIAKIAAGSVRDALSILDQAINSCSNNFISNTDLFSMLSMSNKESTIDLLQQITNSQIQEAINSLQSLYYNGIDFNILLNDLLELISIIIRYKNLKSFSNEDLSFTKEELSKLEKLSESVEFTTLTIIWQFIIGTIAELNICNNNYITLEMLIYKACFISTHSQKSKSNFDRKIKTTQLVEEYNQNLKPEIYTNQHIEASSNSKSEKQNLEHTKHLSFREILQLFSQNKELILYHHLYEDVGLININKNIIKLKSLSNLPKNFTNDISQKLSLWTKHTWNIILCEEESDESLAVQDSNEKNKKRNNIIADNKVQNVLAEFKDAKITDIKELKSFD